jgi:hypothetical protein
MDKASTYLLEEYRKAGYVTQVQTFTYSKFQDLGSTLTVGDMTISGRALNGSLAGKLRAPLVAVPMSDGLPISPLSMSGVRSLLYGAARFAFSKRLRMRQRQVQWV